MIRVALILLGLFLISINSSADARGQKFKVYLNFWVESADGGVEHVNLTDIAIYNTCVDESYMLIRGTNLCGKEISVRMKTETELYTMVLNQPIQYEMDKNSAVRSFIIVNGQYECSVKPFGVHPSIDPLGELEYRTAAVLELQDFGEGIVEIAKRSEEQQFLVEARDPPMSVNIGLVIEPRNQPRAQL